MMEHKLFGEDSLRNSSLVSGWETTVITKWPHPLIYRLAESDCSIREYRSRL